ncbi:MAG: hypothetical protein KG003_01655 [Bacteroidetes bacterium]|nr:hypothetical protein [Bacteroidota bacterium]
MKHKNLFIGVISAALLTTFTTSCDKLKEALFVAFNANSASVDFTIPIINTTATTSDLGTMDNTINLDSIIKAETDNQFSLDDIKKITIQTAQLVLLNGDNENNFANFEEGWLTFSTDTKPTPVTIATGLNPDVYSDNWTLPSVPDINLKEYLNGNSLHYVLTGKARRVTTKVLDCKLNVTFHIE